MVKKLFYLLMLLMLGMALVVSCAEDATDPSGDDDDTGSGDDSTSTPTVDPIVGTWNNLEVYNNSSYGIGTNDYTYTFTTNDEYTLEHIACSTNGISSNYEFGTYSLENDILKLSQEYGSNGGDGSKYPKTNERFGYCFIESDALYLGLNSEVQKVVSGTALTDGSRSAMYMYSFRDGDGTVRGSSNYAELMISGTNLIFTNITGHVYSNGTWNKIDWIFMEALTDGYTIPIDQNDGSILGLWFGPEYSFIGKFNDTWLVSLTTNNTSSVSSKYEKQ